MQEKALCGRSLIQLFLHVYICDGRLWVWIQLPTWHCNQCSGTLRQYIDQCITLFVVSGSKNLSDLHNDHSQTNVNHSQRDEFKKQETWTFCNSPNHGTLYQDDILPKTPIYLIQHAMHWLVDDGILVHKQLHILPLCLWIQMFHQEGDWKVSKIY